MNQLKLTTGLISVALALSACTGFKPQGSGSSSESSFGPTGSSLQFSIASVTSPCAVLTAKAATRADVTQEFKDCVDSIPAQGTLELPKGIYIVSKTINFPKAIQVRTAGVPDGFMCELSAEHSCAEIRAAANMDSDNATGFVQVTATGSVLKSLVINGNRAERLGSSAANSCRAGSNVYGYNLRVAGSQLTIEGIVTKNALCGSGFLVGGDHLNISRNTVAYNGSHSDQNMWSDGITATEASASDFVGNHLIDNSDVDLIFGGCAGCRIQNNQIDHSTSFANSSFAALMLHAWPSGGTTGNYTGADVAGNVVDCGSQRRCGIGLYLGAESWYSSPLFGGFVHDNLVRNALNGFLVEKASGMVRIKDNMVTSCGGQTLTSSGRIREAYAYNIPVRANVRIEDTKIAMSSYQAVSFAGEIPNDWTRDLPFGTVAPAAPAGGGAALDANSARTIVIAKMQSDLLRSLADINADPTGLNYWIGVLVNGLPVASMVDYFHASDEYFVRQQYRTELRRAADPTGLAYWQGILSSNQQTRVQVTLTLRSYCVNHTNGECP